MIPDQLAQVRCFLFDMDGTVFPGGRLLPGAAELLAYLSARRIPHYFLTNNSSRSRAGGMHLPGRHAVPGAGIPQLRLQPD